jgi:hypothetical protein
VANDQDAERAARLRALRTHLRRAFGAAAEALPPRGVPTGFPALDALLVSGGLARGRLTALAGLGSIALAHRAVAAATRGGAVAWLDAPRRLAGLALLDAGADLAEVMVVRPTPDRPPWRALGILLRTGAADLIVVDLPAADARLVRRLAQLARTGSTAVVLLAAAPQPWLAAGADAVLLVERAAWRQDGVALRGCEVLVTVARQRGGREGVQARLTVPFGRPLPPLPGLEALRLGVDADRRARSAGDGA